MPKTPLRGDGGAMPASPHKLTKSGKPRSADRHRSATWRPGDRIPEWQLFVDFAVVLQHEFGMACTDRTVEYMCRTGQIPAIRPENMKHAFVVTRPALAILRKRFTKAPPFRPDATKTKERISA